MNTAAKPTEPRERKQSRRNWRRVSNLPGRTRSCWPVGTPKPCSHGVGPEYRRNHWTCAVVGETMTQLARAVLTTW